ncbi:MAG: folylpolyglutamate synthase/dihydrofolate synthase family protein [Eudoraea sp.]|uniref:bifunctional folylpolyglutamate synthase/dihydrofolate synthase n=1 Tax=Eudoraea sp. TaxID=1979955 RepID=UPI003C71E54C
MTYKETLNWMFSQLPMYQQKGPSAYNAKLSTSYALAEHLNYPQKKFKSIHVAGTNGKGSSSHMLASILQEAGYKVGLYTSPHLKDFRERIKINGVSISEEAVSAFIDENKSYLETNRLSFFEMTVGMAFDYFAKQEVDIAIIEVGLGGRLDSTNIIIPEISLITNIGLDHQDLLGNTLEKIAYEKAGIIKEGVPVVVSEYQEEVASVFKEITSEKKTTLTFASEKEYRKYKLPLQGNYQEKNIKGVLEVISQLSSFNIQESDIVKGLSNVIKNTGLLGRWQILAKKPLTICDTAHNKEGLSLVLSQVGQQEFRELHMVIGFVKEKDLDGILPLFPKKAIYYFCKPQVPRGLDVEILKEKAGFYNLLGESYSSAKKAYEAAMQRADPEDLIFIGGSTFTVSDVL